MRSADTFKLLPKAVHTRLMRLLAARYISTLILDWCLAGTKPGAAKIDEVSHLTAF